MISRLSDFFFLLLFRLSSFATDWKQAQIEKDTLRRRELECDRSILICEGSLSPKLLVVLKAIFALYATNGNVLDGVGIRLTKIEATRLWYRCGIKLSNLEEILKNKPKEAERKIVFEDFRILLQCIVEDDEERLSRMALNDTDDSDFEVRHLPCFNVFGATQILNFYQIE